MRRARLVGCNVMVPRPACSFTAQERSIRSKDSVRGVGGHLYLRAVYRTCLRETARQDKGSTDGGRRRLVLLASLCAALGAKKRT